MANRYMFQTTSFRNRLAAKVKYLWTGLPATDGCQISVRLQSTGTAASCRMVVSTNEALTSPVYSGAVAPDATFRIAKLTITGLTANTQYYYGIEVDGEVDSMTKGRFKTFPTGNASFRVAFGSCSTNAGSVSGLTGTESFEAISNLSTKPAVFIHMGDIHYNDIYDTYGNGATESRWHDAIESVHFDVANRAATFRNTPSIYMWDDHDFLANDMGGLDAADATLTARDTAIGFFRRRVPITPASATATDAPYYSFVIGRVRFVVTDLRSNRILRTKTDNAAKTMMGAAQKTWWKGEIDAALAAGQVVAWISTCPFHAPTPSLAVDWWAAYTTERQELADYLVTKNMADRIFLMSGDMHSLAYASGQNDGDYSTAGGGSVAMFHAAPLYGTSDQKGGPYDATVYPSVTTTHAAQYGLIDVADNGIRIDVTFTGYSADGVSHSTYTFSPLPIYRVGLLKGNGTASAGGALTIDLTPLTSMAQDDYIILTAFQSDAAMANTTPTATGFTVINDGNGTGTNYNVNTWNAHKKQGAVVDTTVTINSLAASKNVVYIIAVYRGLDPTTPIDATGSAAGANNTFANPGAVVPVTAGARIYTYYACAQHGTTTSPWSEPGDANDFCIQDDRSIDTTLPILLLATADRPWSTGIGSFNGTAVDSHITGGSGEDQGSTYRAQSFALKPRTS